MTKEELITKLEEASVGSRELDCDIHNFLFNTPFNSAYDDYSIPSYTTSMDDAMTLLPKNTNWLFGSGVPKLVESSNGLYGKPWVRIENELEYTGSNIILALCIGIISSNFEKVA